MASKMQKDGIYVIVLTVYMMVLNLLLIAVLVLIWPFSDAEQAKHFLYVLGDEIRLLLVGCVAGAVGGCVSSLWSLHAMIRLEMPSLIRREWLSIWVRPLISATLGLFACVAMRGGILKVDANVDQLNPYTVGAVVFFIGLFSEQMLDRMRRYAEHALEHKIDQTTKQNPQEDRQVGRTE